MADFAEHDTALCIIPPKHLWAQIDRVRSLHDRNFPNWPPHIKLMYPFVPVQTLAGHMGNVSNAVKKLGPFRIRLKAPDLHHEDERRQAVFLHVDDSENVDEGKGDKFPLDRLCETALGAVRRLERSAWYRSMTVGHALVDESTDEARSLLLSAGLLSGMEWEIHEVHVLVREGLMSKPRFEGSRMIDCASISLRDGGLRVHQEQDTLRAVAEQNEVPGPWEFYNDMISETSEERSPFFYDGTKWILSTPALLQQQSLSAAQQTLTVASYNVLGQTDDFHLLTQNILHADAEADVLVLQEATGLFLSHLLHDNAIQERYEFCTHRPTDQGNFDALSIHKMVVVLSRYGFNWETIPLPLVEFEADFRKEHENDQVTNEDVSDGDDNRITFVRRPAVGRRTRTHNRALLVAFRKSEDSKDPLERPAPLTLAAFCLTPGQNHENYLARALELDAIRHYISSGTPAILAGGFNMPASTLTLGLPYRDFQGALRQIERDLLSSGYIDAWMVAKIENGAEIEDDAVASSFQDDQGGTDGATFFGTVAYSGYQHISRRIQLPGRIFVKPNALHIVENFNKVGKFTETKEYEPLDNSDSSGNGEPYQTDGVDTQPSASSIRNTLPYGPTKAAVKEELPCGVRAVVKLGYEPNCRGPVSVADDRESSVASHLNNGLSTQLKRHESVLGALWDAHGIPLLRECQLRETALEILETVLLGPSLNNAASEEGKHCFDLVVLPVGSYGLDVWTNSSDLDCLCVGNFSLPTFVDLASQRIRQAADKGIRLIRKTENYTGTTLVLSFGDHVKIDVTYARTEWPLSHPDRMRPLSYDALMALKAYRDLDYVRRSVPDIVAFRYAHRFIKIWAESRGIYSAKFGYLSGIQITMLLTRVHKRLALEVALPTVPEILFAFFKEYASFHWKDNMVFDECFHTKLSYSRTSREPLAILSYFPPGLNTSSAATASSVRTTTSEFQRAAKILERRDGTWDDLLRLSIPGHPTSGSLASDDFLKRHSNYIKITVTYWDGETTKGRGFVSWVELHCASLLADLDQRLKGMHIRIWPDRYKEEWQYLAEEFHWAKDEEQYQGVFLIGLDWMEGNTGKLPESVQDTLASILTRFEQQVRRNEQHFDGGFMMIRTDIVHDLESPVPSIDSLSRQGSGKCQSARLQIDNRNWDAHMQVAEDLEDEGEGRISEQETTVQSERFASSKNRKKPATNQPRSAVGPKPEGAGKFRTAADVLNRLRWDASFDHNDFVVGYEDRFLGTMERRLDTWKSEQTHEEFIPQHRILYFKRSSDGVVVWERRTRTDLVFGSG